MSFLIFQISTFRSEVDSSKLNVPVVAMVLRVITDWVQRKIKALDRESQTGEKAKKQECVKKSRWQVNGCGVCCVVRGQKKARLENLPLSSFNLPRSLPMLAFFFHFASFGAPSDYRDDLGHEEF